MLFAKLSVFFILGLILLLVPAFIFATELSSTSFKVNDPIVSGGTSSGTSTSFQVNQSLFQPAIGRSSSNNFQLWGGFQYYYKALANTLTATAGNGEVQLAWTVPQTFLGISVSGYELGTGTSSGVYTFEAVGNITNFTKSGLTNSTPYYFKIKALTGGGQFLVFSNEATATPAGTGPQPPSGGGSGGSTGNLAVSGFGPPSGIATIVLNGSTIATEPIDPTGNFYALLTNLPTGNSRLSIYATDRHGRNSAWYDTRTTIINGQQQSITDALLPPTLTLDPKVLSRGTDIVVTGSTYPHSHIQIDSTAGGPKNIQLTTSSNTEWDFSTTLPTHTLPPGSYLLSATATVNNQTSNKSLPAQFWLDVPPDLPPQAGIGYCGDYNRDNKINIIDFSILIYWFGKDTVPADVDCNKDSIADLVDFSILVYYWTG